MPLAFGACILLIDQWSKVSIQARRGSLVSFRFVPHRARSYEQTGPRAALVLTWLLALASVVILHRLGAWFQSPTSLAGLGLAFGGAAGNLLDILRRRYVVDFIDLGWWPVFNLADVAILGGLAAAFLG